MKRLLSFLILIAMLSCQKETLIKTNDPVLIIDPLTRNEINAEIEKQMSNGDIFYWSNNSDEMIWSASMQSDSIISIGYTLANFDVESNIHLIDLESSIWREKRDEIIRVLQKYQQTIPYDDHSKLPQIQFKTSSLELIKELRERSDIRFP